MATIELDAAAIARAKPRVLMPPPAFKQLHTHRDVLLGLDLEGAVWFLECGDWYRLYTEAPTDHRGVIVEARYPTRWDADLD